MSDVIVCAVDGSEATGRVLDTGQWLATALGARLVVMHATDGDAGAADETVAAIRTHLGDASAEVRLLEGAPAQAILSAAGDEDPELLVVGSRGRGALRSALLGSVSHEVAARTRSPVVVVPSQAEWNAPSPSSGVMEAWSAASTAPIRPWPRSRWRDAWPRGSACDSSSCTPARTSGRRWPIPERARPPRRSPARRTRSPAWSIA